jgi:hypothetical protein
MVHLRVDLVYLELTMTSTRWQLGSRARCVCAACKRYAHNLIEISQGLGEYVRTFKQHKVDGVRLLQLTEENLSKLGVAVRQPSGLIIPVDNRCCCSSLHIEHN